jgi:hypothetical protein
MACVLWIRVTFVEEIFLFGDDIVRCDQIFI